MVGLPNHQVIPDGWSEHHRATMVGTMKGLCSILPTFASAGPVPLGQITTPGETAAPLHTEVPCRVQAINREGEGGVSPSEQYRRTLRYQVTLPLHIAAGLTAGPEGHRVQVTASDDPDQSVIGRVLTISQIQLGTFQWERVLICEDNVVQNAPPSP